MQPKYNSLNKIQLSICNSIIKMQNLSALQACSPQTKSALSNRLQIRKDFTIKKVDQTKVNSIKVEYNKLHEENKKLKAKIQRLKKQLDQRNEEIINDPKNQGSKICTVIGYETLIEGLKKENDKKDSIIAHLNNISNVSYIEQLHSTVQQQERTINKLKNKIKRQVGLISDYKLERPQSKVGRKQFINAIRHQGSLKSSLSDKGFKRLNKIIKFLESSIQAEEWKVAQKEIDIEQRDRKIKEYQEQVENLNIRIDQRDQSISSLNTQLNFQREQLKISQDKVQELINESEMKSKKITNLISKDFEGGEQTQQGQIKSMLEEMQTKDSRISKLEQDYYTLEKFYQNEVERCQSESSQLAQELQMKNTEIEEFEIEKKQHQEQLSGIIEDLREQKAINSYLQEQISSNILDMGYINTLQNLLEYSQTVPYILQLYKGVNALNLLKSVQLHQDKFMYFEGLVRIIRREMIIQRFLTQSEEERRNSIASLQLQLKEKEECIEQLHKKLAHEQANHEASSKIVSSSNEYLQKLQSDNQIQEMQLKQRFQTIQTQEIEIHDLRNQVKSLSKEIESRPKSENPKATQTEIIQLSECSISTEIIQRSENATQTKTIQQNITPNDSESVRISLEQKYQQIMEQQRKQIQFDFEYLKNTINAFLISEDKIQSILTKIYQHLITNSQTLESVFSNIQNQNGLGLPTFIRSLCPGLNLTHKQAFSLLWYLDVNLINVNPQNVKNRLNSILPFLQRFKIIDQISVGLAYYQTSVGDSLQQSTYQNQELINVFMREPYHLSEVQAKDLVSMYFSQNQQWTKENVIDILQNVVPQIDLQQSQLPTLIQKLSSTYPGIVLSIQLFDIAGNGWISVYNLLKSCYNLNYQENVCLKGYLFGSNKSFERVNYDNFVIELRNRLR